MNSRLLISLALGLAFTGVASAQQYVYPAKARAACLEGRGYTVK